MNNPKFLQAKQQCYKCPKVLNTLNSLKSHLAHQHFKDDLLSKSGSSMDKCGICGRSNNGDGAHAELVMTWHLAYTHMLLKVMVPKHFQKIIFSPKLPGLKSKLSQPTTKIKKAKGNKTLANKMSCPLCPKKLKTLHTLKSHLAAYHFKEELLKRSGSSDQRCGICGKQYGVPGRTSANNNLLMMRHLAYTHKILKTMIPKQLYKLIFGYEKNAKLPLEQAIDSENTEDNTKYIKEPKDESPNVHSWKFLDTSYGLTLTSSEINNIEESDEFQPKLVIENMKVEAESWNNKNLITPILESSINNSTSTAKHTCFRCGGNYATWRSLQSHLAQYHFKDELFSKSGSAEHKCGICNVNFHVPGRPKSRSDLIITSHLAFVHDMLRPLISQNYECEALDLSSKQEKSLKVRNSIPEPTHVFTHQTEKLVANPQETLELSSGSQNQCFLCSSRSTSRISLRHHVAKYHFKNELLKISNSLSDKCGICEKHFGKPGYLRSRIDTAMTWHLAYKHDLLKQLIPKKFNQVLYGDTQPKKRRKKRARQENLPNQPCFLCTSSFKTWDTLKNHLASYHFKDDLMKESGSTFANCGICNKQFNKPGLAKSGISNSLSQHLAFAHGLLGQLIPRYSKFKDTFQPIEEQPEQENLTEQQPGQEATIESQPGTEPCLEQLPKDEAPIIADVDVHLAVKEEDKEHSVFGGGGKNLSTFADLAFTISQR